MVHIPTSGFDQTLLSVFETPAWGFSLDRYFYCAFPLLYKIVFLLGANEAWINDFTAAINTHKDCSLSLDVKQR